VASNRQCVTADDNRCVASASRGDDSVIILYEKNFIIAVNARDVIWPDVEDDRITAKKGPNNEGKSNVVISPRQQEQKSTEVERLPLQSASSLRSLENSAMSMLSAL
jgi:hypothetical protein